MLTVSLDNAVLITGFENWVTTRLYEVPGPLPSLQFRNEKLVLVPKGTNVLAVIDLSNDQEFYFGFAKCENIRNTGAFLFLD